MFSNHWPHCLIFSSLVNTPAWCITWISLENVRIKAILGWHQNIDCSLSPRITLQILKSKQRMRANAAENTKSNPDATHQTQGHLSSGTWHNQLNIKGSLAHFDPIYGNQVHNESCFRLIDHSSLQSALTCTFLLCHLTSYKHEEYSLIFSMIAT